MQAKSHQESHYANEARRPTRDRIEGKSLSCEATFASLTQGRGASELGPEWLDELERSLRGQGTSEAFRQIQDFLRTGKDVKTGGEFQIGRKGRLKSADTLRVALLEIASRLDAQEAANLAKDILSQPTTPEEWSLALRNFARVHDDSEARAYLKAKTRELIRHPDWQNHPSAGYFEAFDVLVHTRATDAAGLLADLVTGSRRDIQYAAFLAMDRLTITTTGPMLTELSQLSSQLAARPEMTAGLFARADVRDKGQREVLESWLSSRQRTEAEWGAFAGVYPNANALVSENLLTQTAEPASTSFLDHDRAALSWVTSMMSDPRFANRRPLLEKIFQRVRRFQNDGAK